jgi:hypothetical protein
VRAAIQVMGWGDLPLKYMEPPKPAPPISSRARSDSQASIAEWRRVAHGWAIYLHWHRWDPLAADVHRRLHQDKDRGEEPWLREMGTASDAHKLKLLLGHLEEALEEARRAIRTSHDHEAANQLFIARFRAELEHMRTHVSSDGDPLGSSYQTLRHLLPVLKHLKREMEDADGLMSLFG